TLKKLAGPANINTSKTRHTVAASAEISAPKIRDAGNAIRAMTQRTIKLSDRRTDVSKPETPRPNPTAQPGSLQRLVRQSKLPHSKISGPRSRQKHACDPLTVPGL